MRFVQAKFEPAAPPTPEQQRAARYAAWSKPPADQVPAGPLEALGNLVGAITGQRRDQGPPPPPPPPR